MLYIYIMKNLILAFLIYTPVIFASPKVDIKHMAVGIEAKSHYAKLDEYEVSLHLVRFEFSRDVEIQTFVDMHNWNNSSYLGAIVYKKVGKYLYAGMHLKSDIKSQHETDVILKAILGRKIGYVVVKIDTLHRKFNSVKYMLPLNSHVKVGVLYESPSVVGGSVQFEI